MAKIGAPPGNQNNAKGRQITDALHKALVQYEDDKVAQGQAIAKIAQNIVKMALAEDKWAIEFIADRMEGKPKQTAEIEHTGSIEHRGLPEIGERVRDILSRGTDSDSSALLLS